MIKIEIHLEDKVIGEICQKNRLNQKLETIRKKYPNFLEIRIKT